MLKQHWDTIYSSKAENTLGWYEPNPKTCLELIDELALDKNEIIIDVGCGVSYLADNLLEKGFQNLILSDISQAALDKLENRLSSKFPNTKIEYIQDDLSNSRRLMELSNIKLWHDRAVLHFLTEKRDRNAYFEVLNKVLLPGGYAIIAEFAENGATKCSGLDVFRYSSQMLHEFLGVTFKLLKTQEFTYINPSGGERPYIYTVWQKI